MVPDALSRLETLDDNQPEGDVLEELLTNSVTMLQMDEAFKQQLLKAYDEDDHWSNIKAIIHTAEPGSTTFSTDDDGLVWLDKWTA